MFSIGIDLGTTNTVASYIDNGRPRVISNRDEKSLTPSVVSYRPDGRGGGQYLVGIQAVRYAEAAPHDTIYSVKRLMGLNFDDEKVTRVRDLVPYSITPAPDGSADIGVRVQINSQPYTPIEISARILQQVKEDCSERLHQRVEGATITVPAYFQDCQRHATKEAGENAGLRLRPLLDEPVAAALAFGFGPGAAGTHRLLVYDLGGGTFDVSLVQLAGNSIQVLDKDGDMWLGGDDFDQLVAARIYERLKDRYGLDDAASPQLKRRVKTLSEMAKIALSSRPQYQILDPCLPHESDKGLVTLDLTITRDEFDADIAPLVDQSISLADKVLARNSIRAEHLTAVLLVGGSTLVPQIRQKLETRFPGRVRYDREIDAMHCVSLGAALWNQRFPMDSTGKISLANFDQTGIPTAMDLGIEIFRDGNPHSFEVIIPRGTIYPTREPRRGQFRPTFENQRLIRVPVFQGNTALTAFNACQGVIEFPLPQAIPVTTPVEIGFQIDEHGNLTVAIEVKGYPDLRRTEVIKRNQATLSKDQAERIGRWKDELENALTGAEHFLNKYQSFCSPDDRKQLINLIATGRQALEASDRENGQSVTRGIYVALMQSGTASVLYQAQRAQEMAETRVATQIAQLRITLEKAHKEGKPERIQEISDSLLLVVNRVVGARREKYGGPLEGQLSRL